MKEKLRKEIRAYIKETNSLIFTNSKLKTTFLNDFQNDVNNFAEENDIDSIEQIKERFGNSESVARSFLENADLRQIRKQMAYKKTICIIAGVVLAIWISCLTAVSFNVITNQKNYYENRENSYEEKYHLLLKDYYELENSLTSR